MTNLRKLTHEWEENDRAERQYVAAADDEWTRAERDEYNEILEREAEEYWAAHCPAHGEALDSLGGCSLCEQEWEAELQEERIRDM